MPLVYRKTDKGHAEIETRAHRLTPRLRASLIMVDGRRTDDELRKLITVQPDECLASLLADGFIEVAPSGSQESAARTVPPDDGPASAKPSSSAAPSVSPTLSPTMRPFEETRRIAVRAINDALGPLAEGIALKIERSRSHDELRPLLETARTLIREARGDRSADEFAARVDLPA